MECKLFVREGLTQKSWCETFSKNETAGTLSQEGVMPVQVLIDDGSLFKIFGVEVLFAIICAAQISQYGVRLSQTKVAVSYRGHLAQRIYILEIVGISLFVALDSDFFDHVWYLIEFAEGD